MEIYYEQNVVNKNIDERRNKTKTLTIAQTVCMIIAIGALLTIILFISDDSFLFLMMIFIIISVPFIIAAIILGVVNKRNNTEYDYVLDDTNLQISEIYYRERRKLKHAINLRTIQSIGVAGSEGYKKFCSPDYKRNFAIVNYEDEDSILYILYNTDKGKRIMFLEPDKGFLIALRRVVNAISVFDKSVSELDKKLDEAED